MREALFEAPHEHGFMSGTMNGFVEGCTSWRDVRFVADCVNSVVAFSSPPSTAARETARC